MSSNLLNKSMSIWWARILIFLALFVSTVMIFGAVVNIFTENADIWLKRTIDGMVLFLSLIFSSVLVESMSPGGKALSFGLMWDKFSLKDILLGFYIVAFTIFFTLIISYTLDVNIQFYPNDIDFISFVLFSIMIFFFAINEELMFRGIIFQTLIRRFNPILISLLISLAFSFVHSSNPNVSNLALVNVFLAGFLMSMMYIATNNLWLPISYHVLWNWGQHVFLGSPISGFDMNNEIILIDFNTENQIFQIIFGGSFGIEEGWFTTIYLLLLIPIVIKYSTPSPFVSKVLFKRKYEESKILNA